MFKRGYFAALALGAACVLSACGEGGLIPAKAPELNVPFETDVKLQAGELELNGSMRRCGTGIWEMTAEAPETLAGLEISYSDEGVTAKLDGLTMEVPMEQLNENAVFARIFKAVDSAAAAGELNCAETADGKVFSGECAAGRYSVTFDQETLVPVKVELPNAGISAELENFRVMTEKQAETGGTETSSETETSGEN